MDQKIPDNPCTDSQVKKSNSEQNKEANVDEEKIHQNIEQIQTEKKQNEEEINECKVLVWKSNIKISQDQTQNKDDQLLYQAIAENQKLSQKFKAHHQILEEQEQLLIQFKQGKAKIVTIPHIRQKIEAGNIELLFWVLAENLRRDQARILLLTPESSKTGLASALYPEASNHQFYQINFKNVDYFTLIHDETKLNQFIYEFKQNVIQVLSISAESIKIIDISQGSIKLDFQIDIPSLTESQREMLEQVCGGKIEIFKYFVGEQFVGLSLKDFNPKYNMQWGLLHQEKQKRGPSYYRYDYYFPRGYYGHALNVDKYDDKKWLLMDGNDEEWNILFHGTGYGAMKPIAQNGFQIFPRQRYVNQQCDLTKELVGAGVYLSDKVDVAEKYAREKGATEVDGKLIYLVFQSRVNPKKLKQSKDMMAQSYFVVNETKDIRPYRILLKVEQCKNGACCNF